MDSLDDTQPRSPFRKETPKHDTQESAAVHPQTTFDTDDDSRTGPGCWVWGFLVLGGVVVSIVIVILAGAAGWTEGHRVANTHATATQAEFIQEQLRRIPTDVAAGNQYNLGVRLNFLATLTPAVPQIHQLQMTGTALYFQSLPTETPRPSETVMPTGAPTGAPPTGTPSEQPPPDATAASSPTPGLAYDLAGLLDEARLALRLNDFQEAYEILDIIIRVDDQYERATVRGLMSEALRKLAANLFRSNSDADLAEAIHLTDMAEQYGPIDELSYERLIAGLYLDIRRAIGAGNHALSISLLNNIIVNYQATYKNVDFRQMLFNEYIAYGDAWGFGLEYCQAAAQYTLALNWFSDPVVTQKRDTAQELCERPPTPEIPPVEDTGETASP